MEVEYGESILEQTRAELGKIARDKGLLDADVRVLAKPLTPQEAIGTPGRRDFPIIVGKERILEADVLGSKGHAFTDSAREFTGTVREVLELPLTSNQSRAIFLATLNGLLCSLGLAERTVHCKDDEPEDCGEEIARSIRDRFGEVVVGLIGMNPAIAQHLVQVFGADRVLIADLFAETIGKDRFGVEIWDGASRAFELIARSDVVLVTGTTLQNGTFDDIWDHIRAEKKSGILYGVTAAGTCALTGIPRLCPCGRNG